MMNVEIDTEPWGDKWRAGTSNFSTVAELFTKRNLWALAAFNEIGISNSISDIDLQFLLSWSILKCFKYDQDIVTIDRADNSKGTYYVPQIYRDLHVSDTLWKRTFTDYKADHLEKQMPITVTELTPSNYFHSRCTITLLKFLQDYRLYFYRSTVCGKFNMVN